MHATGRIVGGVSVAAGRCGSLRALLPGRTRVRRRRVARRRAPTGRAAFGSPGAVVALLGGSPLTRHAVVTRPSRVLGAIAHEPQPPGGAGDRDGGQHADEAHSQSPPPPAHDDAALEGNEQLKKSPHGWTSCLNHAQWYRPAGGTTVRRPRTGPGSSLNG